MCGVIDGARLRSTSKRCHRRVSRDVVGRTSGSRRRRISGSASVSVTSSARGMLFGRPLDDICQPDLPRPLIQVCIEIFFSLLSNHETLVTYHLVLRRC